MKNIIRAIVLSLLASASVAYAANPAVNVTVSDSGGKAAFKGATNASGAFATSKLAPGNYVVQFTSKDAAVKGKHYTLVVSAGTKKVSANAVTGEQLAGPGVAMKVNVASGTNITGQVASEAAGAVKNGKKMVWIGPQLGSNRPGHWAEEGSAEAISAKTAGSLSTQDVQNRQNQGISPGR